jgi:hypothetical protein
MERKNAARKSAGVSLFIQKYNTKTGMFRKHALAIPRYQNHPPRLA